MAMSNGIRKELGKARELLWHLLDGKKCCFCKESLLPDGVPSYVKFGNGSAPGIDIVDITIHHKDGNHNNNKLENRKLAHRRCHKSYHAPIVFRQWRKRMAA